MKLVEFIASIEGENDEPKGTFIGAKLTSDSNNLLKKWMDDNQIKKAYPKKKFHVTVAMDKNRDLSWNPATFTPTLEIDPGSYKIKKFNDFLVLSFSCPELEKRHDKAIKMHNINWDFDSYQPHITFSKDPNSLNDMEKILLPTFPIHINNEYVEPFNSDFS